MKPAKNKVHKRHKCYEETHRAMIETAVRLISQTGVEALSMALLARAMGINRTTVYYHFESREALISAVKAWSAEQLSKAFEPVAPQHGRIDYTTRFVLENPALIKLWIDDLISEGDIRTRYPHWDDLVEAIRKRVVAMDAEDTVDVEVYSVILLTGAIIGPRIFRNSVSPSADIDTVVRRFRGEYERLLMEASLLKPEVSAAGKALDTVSADTAERS